MYEIHDAGEIDVIDQVRAYSTWLERHEGVTLQRPSTLSEPSSPPTAPDQPPPLRAVAVLILIVGAIGAYLAMLGPGTPTATEPPPDPPIELLLLPDHSSGPLFVLPGTSSGLDLDKADANVLAPPGENDADLFPAEVMMVGTYVGGNGEAYEDVSMIMVTSSQPDEGFETTTIETPTGSAEVADSPGMGIITQQRGDHWVTVYTRPDQVPSKEDVLQVVRLGEPGQLELVPNAQVDLISQVPIDPTTMAVSSTWLFANHVDSDKRAQFEPRQFSIVTRPAILPFPGGPAETAGRLSSLPVDASVSDEVTGWWTTHSGSREGESNGIMWQASPNQMIAISGLASMEDVLAVAETLYAVDEDTWLAEFPDALVE